MAITVTTIEKEILASVSIPPRPQALMKISQEAKKAQPEISIIADAISEDPAISSAVLHVVNSAAFARANKVSSIQQAVMTLGIKRIFPLVKAVALKSAMPENPQLSQFWQNSALVASACTMYTSLLNKPDFADNAYMLGLFHNAGVPLMLQSFDDYQGVLTQGMDEGWHDISELEREKYQTSHSTLGAILAQQWQLPTAMVEVIYYFHDVDGIFESGELSKVSLFLLAILKLARSSVDGLLIDEVNTSEWLKVQEPILELLHIDELRLDDMREKVSIKLAADQEK